MREIQQIEKVWDRTSISNVRMILLVVNYCIGYMYIYPIIASMISLLVNPDANSLLVGLEFIIYAFMIVFCIIVGWPILKEEYFLLKNEKWEIGHKICVCLKNLLFIYISNMILGPIIRWLSQADTSANQTSIEQSVLSLPFITIFAVVIFAPIVEEIVFRGVIYRFIRLKYNFIKAAIISSFAFGFIHVYSSLFTGDYRDLWYMFSYAMTGFIIAKTYEETNSLYGTIFLHFINNAISLLFILSFN